MGTNSKIKSRISAAVVATILTTLVTQNVRAAADPTVHLNPDSLRKMMIDGNPSLISQLNLVQQAKDQVRISRNQLLPSINLGALLATAAGPTFALSSISMLLPFLVPANWFNYKMNRKVFDAETISYKILELNTYASIYTLYETVVADQALRVVLEQQYEDLKQVQDLIEKQNTFIGNVKPQDLDNAKAKTNLALVSVSKTDELLVQEFASLRYALGLSLNQNLVVDVTPVPASAFENSALQSVIDESVKIAPEGLQLKTMIDADRSAKWGAAFGWINSAAISASSQYSGGTPQPLSFDRLAATGSFSLGFATFPQVRLAQDKVDAIRIALDQLTKMQTLTLESTMDAIAETRTQLQLAIAAEAELIDVYKIQQSQFSLGTTDLESLLYTRDQVTIASTTRVNTQASLDALRITLNRAMLENEFAGIQGCLAPPPAPHKFGDGFKKFGEGVADVFSGKHAAKTLDEICHNGG